MERTLGQEIRRLRMEAEITLRQFAINLDISATYQSDIEHDRRRPPDALLRKMAERLKHVGASFETLVARDTRLDPEVRAWADRTPGVRDMLRTVRDSGRDPRDILRGIERAEKKKGKR